MIDYASMDAALGNNWYDIDPALQNEVRRYCPPEHLAWAERKLTEFGEIMGNRIGPNAEVIDQNPPRLERYDRWANEVNTVEHSSATIDSKRALWSSGYVTKFINEFSGSERPPAAARIAADYLLSQADTGLVCSTGMTAGVAALVDRYAPADVREELLAKLSATSYDEGTDGSMFLTEREGGSDLGRTVHCTAEDIGDGRVLVNGEKWFCSNVDGDAIVMLARPRGADVGTRQIGLYLVPRIKPDGEPNGIHIRRLKDKLGTKSVPTAEVEFEDALGYALRATPSTGAESKSATRSDVGGLNRMMEMVNGSRHGVAMMGLGIARRSLVEAAIWAHEREAKGKLLIDLPLVRHQIVDQLVEVEAAVALGFSIAGRQADYTFRRSATPAIKVRLTRLGVEASLATVELFGGNGYCEDFRLTRQLRDAIAHPIWEGTENICRLDALRVVRDDDLFAGLVGSIDELLDATVASAYPFTKTAQEATRAARDRLVADVASLNGLDNDLAQVRSAPITDLLASTISSANLLFESIENPRKGLVAARFAQRRLDGGDAWDATIALGLGREILAYDDIDEDMAAALVA